ncbi:MAG: CRTAC1 family protein [Acidobacteriota bacterium]
MIRLRPIARRVGRLLVVHSLLSVPAGAASGDAAQSPPSRFVDVAREVGLVHPTWCGGEEKPHLLESGGTGLALVDYDGDGDLDLYLVNGWRLGGPESPREILERGKNRLYRNRGDGTFDDVTEHAGVGSEEWGTGIAAGDFDGDGWTDLFATNFGPDVLYRNRGDGTFEEVEGAPSIDGWSTGAVFFDAEGDGDDDLFIAGQVDCTLEEVLDAEPELEWEGAMVMLGPFGLDGLANRYFENLSDEIEGGDASPGDRSPFREATAEAGLTDKGEFYSFAVAALDLDDDLDLDLYVANDSNPNYLYENRSESGGPARFQEVGLWSGAALDQGGNAQAGMGVATGDVDGDGRADLVVTNFWRDATTLYRNLGDLIFEDATRPLGVRDPSYQPLSWGTALGDLDLDGDLDLFIANGHIFPQADDVPSAQTSYAQRNLLLVQEEGRFVDVSDRAGPGLEVVESSRGLAVGDVDGDGDLDLAISNVDAPPTLLRNDAGEAEGVGSPRHWLLVDAPGVLRAELRVGGVRRVRHRVLGSSYVSVSDRRFHFGLGGAERVEGLRLVHPDGRTLEITGLPANRALVIP